MLTLSLSSGFLTEVMTLGSYVMSNASRSGSSRTIVTEEVGISGPDPAGPSGAAHTADYAARGGSV